jgi:hypothetical protein
MPSSSLFSPLLHHVQSSPPVEFQLPEDIRTYFKFGEFLGKNHATIVRPCNLSVGSNPRGQYVDLSLIKAPRLK